MKNKYSENIEKFFSKKRNVIIFTGILLIFVLLIFVLIFNDGDILLFAESDSNKFEREYESLNDKIAYENKKYPEVDIVSNNKIKYFTIEEFLTLIDNKGDAVVYFGYETCLYCRNAIEVLINVAVETKLDEILYINIEDYWDVLELDANGKVITKTRSHSKYYEMLDVLGNELTEDYLLKDMYGASINTEKKRIEVPLVIFIADGKIVSYRKGTIFSQKDPFVKLNDSQKESLGKIYKNGISDVIKSKEIEDDLK